MEAYVKMSSFNADDKTFLIGWFNTLKDQIKDVQTHLDKTCDELHEVDNKVVKLGVDMKNHLDDIKKVNDNKKETANRRRLNRKEIVAFGFGAVGSTVGIVSVFG